MTTYPALLEKRLAEMLATMQRRVTLLESRTVQIDSGTNIQTITGTVDPAYVPGTQPKVTLAGAAALSGPYQYLTPYVPSANDTVLMVPQGTGYVVAGSLSPTAVGSRQYVVKSADQSITNNTTLTPDSVLTVPLVANATYRVEFNVHCASPNNGLQTSWSLPSGTTGSKMCIGPTSVVADGSNRGNTKMRLQGSTTLGVAILYAVDPVASTVLQEWGIVTTAATPGNLVLQWAQITSSATAATMFAGSYMVVTRIG